MNVWNEISGANAGYVLELFERYQRDPASVDEATRAAFRASSAPPEAGGTAGPAASANLSAAIAAVTLAEAIRRYGHLAATLDPLGFDRPVGDPSLHPHAHGVTTDALKAPARRHRRRTGGGGCRQCLRGHRAPADGLLLHHRPRLRPGLRARRAGVAAQARSSRARFRPPTDPIDSRELLDRLTQVEVFERFLQRTFPGKTRFSIEGLDMMVPDPRRDHRRCRRRRRQARADRHGASRPAERAGARAAASRTRRSWPSSRIRCSPAACRIDLGWMGDVKYHAGARVRASGRPTTLVISMPPNPSHLEAVDPVLDGMARAAGTTVDAPGAPVLQAARSARHPDPRRRRLPGPGHRRRDAQPVAADRLRRRAAPSTSSPTTSSASRPTRTSRSAPATRAAWRAASRFRSSTSTPTIRRRASRRRGWRAPTAQRFQRDFLIDLVGYRRYGHNEGDEPAFTQPLLYQRGGRRTRPCASGAPKPLVERGTDRGGTARRARRQARMAALEAAYATLKPEEHYVLDRCRRCRPAAPPRSVQTAVPLDRLRGLERRAGCACPTASPCTASSSAAANAARSMLASPDERTVDWAAAEELALASILADGIAIRLTGEDVERGTFSHRHAVLHDAETGEQHVPLQALPQAHGGLRDPQQPAVGARRARLRVRLQHAGAGAAGDLGSAVRRLHQRRADHPRRVPDVGAAPSGAWRRRSCCCCRTATKARGRTTRAPALERFLQLAADINMRIVNCTTAAQYFHLLRRQALLLETDPLPLIVLTPKSLLRHPMVASPPRELAEGRFRLVIDDEDARRHAGQGAAPGAVQRQGLRGPRVERGARRQPPTWRSRASSSSTRSPPRPSRGLLERYPKLREVCWVQEEPENMGALGVRAAASSSGWSTAGGRCATSAACATRARRKARRRGIRRTSGRSSPRPSKRRPTCPTRVASWPNKSETAQRLGASG